MSIKTRKLPKRVEIDDIGNTISAADYRREKADFLALEVSRIAWSPSAVVRARNLVTAARCYSKG